MVLTARLALLIAALQLLAPFAHAQDAWERPRNTLTLPVSAPTTVEIYLPQRELYASSYGMSPVVSYQVNPVVALGVTNGVAAILENKDEATTAKLCQDMPTLNFDGLLKEAFLRHLDARHFAAITKVVVHHGEPAHVETSSPADPEEQVLALRVRYHFTPRLASLRVAATARLGPRRVVASAPNKDAPPLFSQEVVYDLPGDAGTFALPGTRAQVWSSMGGPALAQRIANGIDGVMAMLAGELGRQPRFGRVSGKQIAWGEGPHATYGVVEHTVGDRNWIRMRNGWLVSLPAR